MSALDNPPADLSRIVGQVDRVNLAARRHDRSFRSVAIVMSKLRRLQHAAERSN
ncbi:MAG: hypothetical protein WA418_20440 [Bradyrhizobium sp.]